jgi:hypothetical protein
MTNADSGDSGASDASADNAASGDNRWSRRSGWIAEPVEPVETVDAPATRPIRTRSRIVAAAGGEANLDLTDSSSPPAVPAPNVTETVDVTEPIDLRSEDIRSLLLEGAGTTSGPAPVPTPPAIPTPHVAASAAAQENEPVKNAEPGGGGPDETSTPRAPASRSSKWGGQRGAPEASRSTPRLTVTDPQSKYGPSLVSLADQTDPSLSIAPASPDDRLTPSTPDEATSAVVTADVPEPASPATVQESGTAVTPRIDTPAPNESMPLERDEADGAPEPAAAQPTSTLGFAPPQPAVESADQTDDGSMLPEHVATQSLVDPRDGSDSGPRFFTSAVFVVAVALAVVAGILGALWQRERTQNSDLQEQLQAASVAAAEPADDSADLTDDLRALELENERLAREVAELETLVAPVPPGRITTIDTPFSPNVVDEARGRLIAIDAAGEYVVWGEGADAGITNAGMVSGIPTGLFAYRDNAWIAQEGGGISVISLVDGSSVLQVETGDVSLIVPSSRTVWSYSPTTLELRRHREANGNITATIQLPVGIRELSAGAGSIWALGEDGLVYRVNTADLTVAPIAAGQEVVSIAAGTDALWALSAADGSLRRVDAVSGEVLVTVPVGRDPIAAEFSGSSIWVALRSGETLIEVDTRTAAVVSRTSLPGVPLEITSGGDGVLVSLEGDVPLVRVASAEGEVIDDAAEGDQADG